MKRTLTAVIVALGLSTIGCGSQEVENESANPLTADKDIQIAELKFGGLTTQLMSEVIECTGEIDIPPSDRASVFAPIGGVLGDIKILPGTLVKKGEVLASLQHRDIIKLQQDYLISQSNFDLAQLVYQRKKVLFEKDVTSASDFQMVKSTYEVAASELEGLKAQLKIIGISVSNLQQHGISQKIYLRSPIDGYVATVSVNTGMYVGLDEEVLTIINPEHKHVELEIYAKDIGAIKPDQHLHFQATGREHVYEAEILLIGQMVDEESRTVSVHAHLLDEHPELVVGTHISASIYTLPDSVYSLPEEAIFNTGDENIVLVQDGDNLKQKTVQIGRKLEGFVEILNYESLLNEAIVIKDAYYFHD